MTLIQIIFSAVVLYALYCIQPVRFKNWKPYVRKYCQCDSKKD